MLLHLLNTRLYCTTTDISIEPIRIQGKAFNVYLSTGKCVPQSDECPGDGKGRRVFQYKIVAIDQV